VHVYGALVSENLRLYTTIVFGFEHVLRLVPAAAWDDPSPCEGWTARQVAGHAMGVDNNDAARAGEGTLIDAFADVAEIAGDDPLETFRAIRWRYLVATDRPGALQRPVTSSLGEMTVDAYLGKIGPDTLVHTWDVARATGVDARLDPAAVRAVYAEMTSRPGDGWRARGHFQPALASDGDADLQDRLIAFTGRATSRS
jgi:uncharacterized protein (TIGR03086 family)